MKCLNIAEPRIFSPPKITRYTVYSTTQKLYSKAVLKYYIFVMFHHDMCKSHCTMYSHGLRFIYTFSSALIWAQVVVGSVLLGSE